MISPWLLAIPATLAYLSLSFNLYEWFIEIGMKSLVAKLFSALTIPGIVAATWGLLLVVIRYPSISEGVLAAILTMLALLCYTYYQNREYGLDLPLYPASLLSLTIAILLLSGIFPETTSDGKTSPFCIGYASLLLLFGLCAPVLAFKSIIEHTNAK